MGPLSGESFIKNNYIEVLLWFISSGESFIVKVALQQKTQDTHICIIVNIYFS